MARKQTKMVPLTDEELHEVQAVIIDRMLDLTYRSKDSLPKESIDQEFKTLSSLSEKVQKSIKGS